MNQRVGAISNKIHPLPFSGKAVEVKTKNGIKIKLPEILLGVFIFVCLVLGFFITYRNIYANRVFAGVKVAGVSLSGKTKSEAKMILSNFLKDFQEKEVVFVYEGEEKKFKLKELGIALDLDKQVNAVYKVGREGRFPYKEKDIIQALLGKKEIPLMLDCDLTKLNQVLLAYQQKVMAPQNASLKIEGDKVLVVEERQGYKIDTAEIQSRILENLSNLDFSPVNIAVVPAAPQIKQEDIAKTKMEAETMISRPLIFVFEDKSYEADATQIGQFLQFQQSGGGLMISFNEEAIDKYVKNLALKIDKKPIDTEKLSTTGEVIKEGSDGRFLDRAYTKEQIKRALSGETKSIALKVDEKKHGEKIVFPDNVAVAGRFPGKYIDIDLSEQKLYAFEDNNLIKSFAISSGLSRTPTPKGTFSIYSKSRAALMRGEGYYLPGVEWVSWFYGSYSIHGTYWHHNFGHPMSHGCVNASNGDAQFIYQWAPIGTPVYIHK